MKHRLYTTIATGAYHTWRTARRLARTATRIQDWAEQKAWAT